MRAILAATMLLIAASAGYAQQPTPQPTPPPALQQPPPDPRLAGPLIQTLQSMVALRDAQLQALRDDYDKRIADLEKLCGDACKPKPTAEVKPQ